MSASRMPILQPMKQLNKWQNAIFIMGALLMVAGAASSVVRWTYYPYAYSLGAVCYVAMQVLQAYEGRSFVIRRLKRIQLLSNVLLILTGALMFASEYNSFGYDWLTYLNYVHNNWVVTLLIAAILQLYTTYRMGSELEKEVKKR